MEKSTDKRFLSPSRAGHVPPAQRLRRTTSAKAPDYTGRAIAGGQGSGRGKTKSRVFTSNRFVKKTVAGVRKRHVPPRKSQLDVTHTGSKSKKPSDRVQQQGKKQKQKADTDLREKQEIEMMRLQRTRLKSNFKLRSMWAGCTLMILVLLDVLITAHKSGAHLRMRPAYKTTSEHLADGVLSSQVERTYMRWRMNGCQSFEQPEWAKHGKQPTVFDEHPDLKDWAIKWVDQHCKQRQADEQPARSTPCRA